MDPHFLRIVKYAKSSEASLNGLLSLPDVKANNGKHDQNELIREFLTFETASLRRTIVRDYNKVLSVMKFVVQGE